MPSHLRHSYETELVWTGNTGTGTATYRSYERSHEVRAPGVAGRPRLRRPGLPR